MSLPHSRSRIPSYKTALQGNLASARIGRAEYDLVEQSGPAHDPLFGSVSLRPTRGPRRETRSSSSATGRRPTLLRTGGWRASTARDITSTHRRRSATIPSAFLAPEG